jgi:sarcosine oxidase, subunit delta
MQIFPCPFCGPRDEIEFHYVGEPKARPEPAGSVSDAAWADYLWFNANPKGEAREIWLHLTCMEMFAMTRDTALNATVAGDLAAREAP